jgi:hypothetical protein
MACPLQNIEMVWPEAKHWPCGPIRLAQRTHKSNNSKNKEARHGVPIAEH